MMQGAAKGDGWRCGRPWRKQRQSGDDSPHFYEKAVPLVLTLLAAVLAWVARPRRAS